MTPVTFLQPSRLTFGSGCLDQCIEYISALATRHVHVITSPSMAEHAAAIARQVQGPTCTVTIDASVSAEPTVASFDVVLTAAKRISPTCVIGLGGGSALDVSKLVAAFAQNSQDFRDTFGIGLLAGRACHLVCIPTTSGTGSEVSPNAILLDQDAALKKGIVSRWLVPDATFIDPLLTITLPPSVTAATGLDTLTHCVEAYTNLFAHPLVDLYALQGITLCAKYLPSAVRDGSNLIAREAMSRASLYGGLCLGPVNTAAVHALAYPLGGEFHLAHGLSNAILLPAVFRFNAESSPARHAEVALALGARPGSDPFETALEGASLLQQLARDCGVTSDLASCGVPRSAIPRMVSAALTVTRLLKNNPRELTAADAASIYESCFP